MSVDELTLAEQVLGLVTSAEPSAEVEVSVSRSRMALTRFATSVIHQNVAEDTTSVRVRIHAAGRTTSGSTTRTARDGLTALVERTLEAVRVAPNDPGWPGVAPPAELGVTSDVDPATADASPDDRALLVRAFVDAADGMETAGYCRTVHWTGAFANSAGHSAVSERADAGMDGIARRSGVDGVARLASNRIADLDGTLLGTRAAAKASAGVDAAELPPGRYAVVLEPTAVADLLSNLAMYGFNGKSVSERRSFVEIGADQFDETLTLVDDPLGAGLAYDAEGTPHRRIELVDAGTTVAVTHDRRTASASGEPSTGHATGMASWGPFGLHFGFEAAGGADPAGARAVATEVRGPAADSTVLDLVAAVERGVLVTDLWYTRVLDSKSLAITGLTRNGIWLIEHGEVVRPLSNFRFTQSYAEALAPGAVLGVGSAAHAQPDRWMSARWAAPALHLASWNFTGGASG